MGLLSILFGKTTLKGRDLQDIMSKTGRDVQGTADGIGAIYGVEGVKEELERIKNLWDTTNDVLELEFINKYVQALMRTRNALQGHD